MQYPYTSSSTASTKSIDTLPVAAATPSGAGGRELRGVGVFAVDRSPDPFQDHGQALPAGVDYARLPENRKHRGSARDGVRRGRANSVARRLDSLSRGEGLLGGNGNAAYDS